MDTRAGRTMSDRPMDFAFRLESKIKNAGTGRVSGEAGTPPAGVAADASTETGAAGEGASVEGASTEARTPAEAPGATIYDRYVIEVTPDGGGEVRGWKSASCGDRDG